MARTLPSSIDETQKLLAAGTTSPTAASPPLFSSLSPCAAAVPGSEAGSARRDRQVIAQGWRRADPPGVLRSLGHRAGCLRVDYSRQMIAIRLAEAARGSQRRKLAADIYSEKFLIKRPLARRPGSHRGLLIDELDRTDEPSAYLLECCRTGRSRFRVARCAPPTPSWSSTSNHGEIHER